MGAAVSASPRPTTAFVETLCLTMEDPHALVEEVSGRAWKRIASEPLNVVRAAGKAAAEGCDRGLQAMRTLPQHRIGFTQALGRRIGLTTELGLVDGGHAPAIHDKLAVDHDTVDRRAVFSESTWCARLPSGV